MYCSHTVCCVVVKQSTGIVNVNERHHLFATNGLQAMTSCRWRWWVQHHNTELAMRIDKIKDMQPNQMEHITNSLWIERCSTRKVLLWLFIQISIEIREDDIYRYDFIFFFYYVVIWTWQVNQMMTMNILWLDMHFNLIDCNSYETIASADTFPMTTNWRANFNLIKLENLMIYSDWIAIAIWKERKNAFNT